MLISCNNTPQIETINSKNYNKIKVDNLISNIKNLDTIKFIISKDEFIKTFIIYNINYNKGLGIIYPLNSNCSVCIGDFISFIRQLDEKSIDIKIHIILLDNDRTTITHYLENINIKNPKNILLYNHYFTNELDTIKKEPILIYNNKVLDR